LKTWAPLAVALALLCSLVPSPARAEAPDARAFVQATADQVLVVLKDQGLSPEQKVKQIEEVAYARFDFDTMARLVLARNWAKLSPAQQKEFVQEFRRHLSVTYGKNVENYRNETIEITSDREEARGDWTVKTKILRSGDDIMVDYRLRKADGQWKIIDVVIERVSLVANFRSQLQDVVATKGADEMLRMLREKNAAGQSILPNDGKVSPGSAPSAAES
jgi:phospholipid transport system substrate-binding protein